MYDTAGKLGKRLVTRLSKKQGVRSELTVALMRSRESLKFRKFLYHMVRSRWSVEQHALKQKERLKQM